MLCWLGPVGRETIAGCVSPSVPCPPCALCPVPGYGDSPLAEMVATAQGRAAFLDHVLQELGMRRPVLVSPSMSGRFALPFLLARGDQLAGFVPVAPVGTKDYTAEQYQQVQVRWVIELMRGPWVLVHIVDQLAGGWPGGWS